MTTTARVNHHLKLFYPEIYSKLRTEIFIQDIRSTLHKHGPRILRQRIFTRGQRTVWNTIMQASTYRRISAWYFQPRAEIIWWRGVPLCYLPSHLLRSNRRLRWLFRRITQPYHQMPGLKTGCSRCNFYGGWELCADLIHFDYIYIFHPGWYRFRNNSWFYDI